MKAKLMKEQMGVPAGTEMEVIETGRGWWSLKAPSGAEIVVPACDVEMVPDPHVVAFVDPAFTEEGEPVEPSSALDYADAGLNPQPVEPSSALDMQLEESQRVHVFGSNSAADFDRTLPNDGDPEPTEEESDGQLAESVFPSDEEPLTNPSTDDD